MKLCASLTLHRSRHVKFYCRSNRNSSNLCRSFCHPLMKALLMSTTRESQDAIQILQCFPCCNLCSRFASHSSRTMPTQRASLPHMTTQIPETQIMKDVASDAGIVDACASDAGDHVELRTGRWDSFLNLGIDGSTSCSQEGLTACPTSDAGPSIGLVDTLRARAVTESLTARQSSTSTGSGRSGRPILPQMLGLWTSFNYGYSPVSSFSRS